MSNVPAEPRLSYETRLDSASADYARVDARWNLVANARLVAFLAAVAAAAWGLWGRARRRLGAGGPPPWRLRRPCRLPCATRTSSGLAWRHCARSRRRRWLASTAAGTISPCPGFPTFLLTTPTPVISISSAGPRSSSCSIRPRPAWAGRPWRAWLLAPSGPDEWPPPGRARWQSWRPSSICGRRSSCGVAWHQTSNPIPRPSSPGRKMRMGSATAGGCAGWPGSVRSRSSRSASRT